LYRVGNRISRLPLFRDALARMPARSRPALYFETYYNLGIGVMVALFLLSQVVLKTILDGEEHHLALLAAMFGGSSLLSPLVSYIGRTVPMRRLIIVPNMIVAALLFMTAMPWGGATLFTLTVGGAYIFRVFPRVAEMNMFRVLYPPTHRGAAVGWVKAIASTAGLTITVLGYWWFGFQPSAYWALYAVVGFTLLFSTMSYAKIPISRKNVFAREEKVHPYRAFMNGLKIFLADKRFFLFQCGFALAGTANHMAIVYVPEVLKEEIHASPQAIGLICAVIPAILMTASSPFWGRYLDTTNPMTGRAVFNLMQGIAFGFHAYGGFSHQVWPFVVGAIIHSIANGGSTINWLTGSLYFAKTENISLYNALHVGLTGVRGFLAPLIGLYLISDNALVLGPGLVLKGLNLGSGLFWVATVLSLTGAAVMFLQGLTDPGPREKLPS